MIYGRGLKITQSQGAPALILKSYELVVYCFGGGALNRFHHSVTAEKMFFSFNTCCKKTLKNTEIEKQMIVLLM